MPKLLTARLSLARKAEHLFFIFSFSVLALTGFSQLFFENHWASWLLHFLGGLDGTRTLHHFFGILMSIHLIIHLGIILFGISFNKIRLSLFPVPQDLRDLVQMWRYRLGFAQRPPTFTGFAYHQKFLYLGMLLSGAVVIVSGLILLFPSATVALLPGHVIPAAREAHSKEGLVAFLILVIWHFYSAILFRNNEADVLN